MVQAIANSHAAHFDLKGLLNFSPWFSLCILEHPIAHESQALLTLHGSQGNAKEVCSAYFIV